MTNLNGILQKITLDEYIKMATAAFVEKRWEEAYEYWDFIRLEEPEHKFATLKTAQALFELAYFEEARALAKEDQARFPDRADTYILLGDIALALNEWRVAVECWDFVCIHHPDNPIGFFRIATMAEARNRAKAVALWREIGERFPKQLGAVSIALSKLFSTGNYWHVARETANSGVEISPNDPNGLLAALALDLKYLQQHEKLNFEKDARLLVARTAHALSKFPNHFDLASLDAKLALHFHNYSAAKEKLGRLLNKDRKNVSIMLQYARTLLITGEKREALALLLSEFKNLTPHHVEAFVHLFVSAVDANALTDLNRQIDDLPHDPVVVLMVAIQLEMLERFDLALQMLDLAEEEIEDWLFLSYLKCRERIINARALCFATGQDNLPNAEEIDYRYAYDHVPERQRDRLEQHIALIDNIGGKWKTVYLNTNRVPYEAFQIAAEIFEAIKQKRPFSLVRPSGFLLPQSSEPLPPSFEAEKGIFEKEQWHENHFLDHDFYQQAILSADVVGIPERFHDLFLEEAMTAAQCQNIALLSYLDLNPALDSTLTSADINHDLQIWGLYDLILSYVDSVAIITDTPLENKLMALFGVGKRIEYLVPRPYVEQTPFDKEPTQLHYPDRFRALSARLEVAYAGELFLVNAGPLGPIYCDLVKQKGGIALDLGETLTFWGGESAAISHTLRENAGYYRAHRTALWWHYLDAVKNIPFQYVGVDGARATTYWINRADRLDRRQATEQNLDRVNAPHQRIEAITPDTLPRFKTRRDQHQLLAVEKACTASHLVALQEGLKNGEDPFFVREDDLEELVSIDYSHLIANAPDNWEILQLHSHGLESLQQGYLAYLSGKLWLPWQWRNPSTALYLTRPQGAEKLLAFANDEAHQELDFRSATPNLVVADRILYRDFNSYTSTYPFVVTNGSQSDILRVNSARHTNAASLAKRIHVLTHADNPQLQFSREETCIKNDRDQNIVIGLGAAPHSYATLHRLLGQQPSSFVSLQMGQHPFRFPSWENDFNQVVAILNYLLQTRPSRFVGDMMSAYLPYVEALIALEPTIKFVSVYDDPALEIESLMHLRPHTNIYQTHDGIVYQHDPLYDRSAPKYGPELGKADAVQRFVEMYAETTSALAEKYPENFYKIRFKDLYASQPALQLLTWIGYTEPQVFDQFDLSADIREINRLDLPSYLDACREKEERDDANVTFELQINEGRSEDDDALTNLFEVHLLNGHAKTKEYINFTDAQSGYGNISLHIDFRREQERIVLNNCVNSIWGEEKTIYFDYAQAELLYIRYDALYHAAYLFNASRTCLTTYALNRNHHLQFATAFGENVRLTSVKRTEMMNQWRFSQKTSGYQALPEGLDLSERVLSRGLSLIIRAKNEEETIERCLTSVAPYVDEVIFVDNGSTDRTRLIAEQLQCTHFNLKVFSYPFNIPRIGVEHSDAVLSGSSNTLGHYYNWCLSKSTTINFAKWDADYICIEENFAEMVDRFQLRTRGDNFVIWFSGLELYTDGEKYWVDTHSLHNEYRVFSKKHGAHWVNLPPWEEIEQSYLYRAHKLVYDKPVYVELFRLDEVEFKDRGIFTGDMRDKVRADYIHQFRESGVLPVSFVEVSGIDDPCLKSMPLSQFEQKDIERANLAFNSLPNVISRLEGQWQAGSLNRQIANLFTAVLSCQKNREKQNMQRQTWLKDMAKAGFTYAFVEGEVGRPSCMIDDHLILNCRDEYEFLASKVLEIVKWVYYETDFDYLLKVDDDVVLNPARLASFDYGQYDYIGGRLITGEFDPLWHANKTWNKQLSQRYFQIGEMVPYYGGQFSYFLSRKAMKVIIDHSDILRGQLYEDCGVAKTLLAGGIQPAPFDPMWGGWNYVEWQANPRYGASCISDIPFGKLKKVYKQWAKAPGWDSEARAFNKQYDVSFDWMDMPNIIAKLKSGSE